jgi:hypothetical protein
MSQIIEELQQKDIQRVFGVVEGQDTGRHAVYFAGIHGNEPAGIWALKRVLKTIEENKIPFRGKLWALGGNLPALQQKIRYIDKDLNRIWFTEFNDQYYSPNGTAESSQRKEIEDTIKAIVAEATDEVFIFDLHTTSSQSVPFVSISDTLRNRKVIEDIPAPLVLGLEEQMEGTLFNFLSEVGISMALFEAGQHELVSSIDSHEAFIWLTLMKLDFVRASEYPDIHKHYELLAKEGIFNRRIFQLKYKHMLPVVHDFTMLPGFVNFQKVKKNTLLAKEEGAEVRAPKSGRIFMPLYQPQGAEGFFIIEQIQEFWLRISEWVRKTQIDRFIWILPGVRKYGDGAFIVNRHIARFTVAPIFHLLGYRVVIRHDKKFIVRRRPYDWTRPPIRQVQKSLKKLLD